MAPLTAGWVAGLLVLTVAALCGTRVAFLRPTLILTAIALGFTLNAALRAPPRAPAHYEPPREVTVTAEVVQVFQPAGGSKTIAGLAVVVAPPMIDPRLRGHLFTFRATRNPSTLPPLPGSRLRLTGRWSWLDRAGDTAADSFEAYLRGRGVSARLDWVQVRAIKSGPPVWAAASAAMKERVMATLDNATPEPAQRSIARVQTAMLTGSRAALPQEAMQGFRRTGVMHLFAVSGLHVGIIAGLTVALLRLSPIRARTQFALGLLAVLGYVWMIGFSASALRATAMLAVFGLGHCLHRKPDVLSSLGAAATVILLWDPAQLRQVGFQLSFAVVAALVLVVPVIDRRVTALASAHPTGVPWRDGTRTALARWLAGLFTVGLVAMLASAPLTIGHFGHFAPVSLFLNAIIMPLAVPAIALTALEALCGLVGFPGGAAFLGDAARGLLWVVMAVVDHAQSWPGADINVVWKAPGTGGWLATALLWLMAASGRDAPAWQCLGFPLALLGLALATIGDVPTP